MSNYDRYYTVGNSLFKRHQHQQAIAASIRQWLGTVSYPLDKPECQELYDWVTRQLDYDWADDVSWGEIVAELDEHDDDWFHDSVFCEESYRDLNME